MIIQLYWILNINKSMKYFVPLACLLLVCCGRSNKNAALFADAEDNDSTPVINFSDLDLDRIPKFSDIFDSISFVKLETRDDVLIGRIDKILAVNDKYVILDESLAKAVLVFDEQGKFVNKIGNNGRGPKEYDSPNDIAYDRYRHEIVIRNNNRKVLMFFKIDGTFVEEIPVDFYFGTMGVASADIIAIYRNNKGSGKDDYNLVMIDRDGNTRNQLLPIDRTTDLLSPPCKGAFSAYGDSLQFMPQYSRTVYDVNESGIAPRYRLDFGKRNIPYSLLKGITNRELSKKIRDSRNYMFCNKFAETADHLIFDFINYDGSVYNCYYSKATGDYIAGAMFINDMYGRVTSGNFLCTKGNMLISAVESGAFVRARDSANKSERTISNVTDETRQNIIKALESADVNMSQREIEFINSVKEDNNPVLRIARLKRF